ncbi:hypothetical protein ITX44_09155 [Streptomyces sp. KK5PA1]|uniref:DUF2231 domain-containing protein n=1 Tax=Actinacidiphila acididurans TaxID=2784346 RepID=A0ABS2TMZ4_9ACTN|nr:hypothetical protein [Actinacidiphila acididurans]
MGPTVVNGLPAHILFVHVVVVLVPLTALGVVAAAVRPGWARRFGLLLPVLALVSLVSVPLTTHAGEWLEKRVGDSPLLDKHTELGDTLLPWALGLFLVSAALWWLGRRAGSADSAAPAPGSSLAWTSTTWFRSVAVVVALIVAVGACVDVYRIGDSGAKAAWTGGFSSKPLPHKG